LVKIITKWCLVEHCVICRWVYRKGYNCWVRGDSNTQWHSNETLYDFSALFLISQLCTEMIRPLMNAAEISLSVEASTYTFSNTLKRFIRMQFCQQYIRAPIISIHSLFIDIISEILFYFMNGTLLKYSVLTWLCAEMQTTRRPWM
jgi:hypothetical protein